MDNQTGYGYERMEPCTQAAHRYRDTIIHIAHPGGYNHRHRHRHRHTLHIHIEIMGGQLNME